MCFTHFGAVKLQKSKDSSLVILHYQLLPLATIKLMGDNKKFDDSAIFLCILLIVGGRKLLHMSHKSKILHSLILFVSKRFKIFCGVFVSVGTA